VVLVGLAVACRPTGETTPPPRVVVATATPEAEVPLLRASAGCGAAVGEIVRGRIVVDGQERTFAIDVPQRYEPSRPLALAYGFHGNWDSGQGARRGYRLAQSWGEPMIAVYPDGLRDAPDGPTTWAFDPGSRDFAFFDALHEAVTAQLCVDLDRVFLFGYSSGGFMANALACTHGEIVRGVAAISAGLTASTCEHPVPAFLAHGESDEIVPFELGVAARQTWATANGCGSDPTRDAAGCERWACEAPLLWCPHPGGHKLLPETPEAAVQFFLQEVRGVRARERVLP
jgi:polyhydroxybutyrate depolymerase